MMNTITNFKKAYEPSSPKKEEHKPAKPQKDVAKGVKKPIKSIIKKSLGGRHESPSLTQKIVVKSRVPKTTASERARIVM